MLQTHDHSEVEPSAEDIFLSYAHEDNLIAQKLAEYFESKGRRVFWDINIRNGDDWRERLEKKLNSVKCVVVLWSKNSVASNYVLEEADFGRSRQVLVTARIDDAALPFGFRRFHVDDLRHWTGETPPGGIVGIATRVQDLVAERSFLVDRTEKDDVLRREQKRSQTAHISVSDHDRDREAVLLVLSDQPREALESIRKGYSELQSAQHAALHNPSERASPAHYSSAAEHFGTALDIIGMNRVRTARDDRSVDYFLSMERANCLVFADSGRGSATESLREAIEIYTRLSHDHRYKNDVPVHFRLGCAFVRGPRTEDNIAAAIRALRKARKLANEDLSKNGATDKLLTEGQWIHAELARQLGLCNYLMSEIPGITHRRRKRYLQDAILETKDATKALRPSETHDELFTVTVLKARGNLLFLLAQQMREGDAQEGAKGEIEQLIAELRAPGMRDVIENQVYIIDDIAFAAATIGDWQIAFEEADRNMDNFASMAVTQGLDLEEKAMDARAREIRFFAKLELGRG